MTAEVETFSPDCVACIAKANKLPPNDAALSVLAILESGHDLEDVVRDLCFYHRRKMNDCAKALVDLWINGRDDDWSDQDPDEGDRE